MIKQLLSISPTRGWPFNRGWTIYPDYHKLALLVLACKPPTPPPPPPPFPNSKYVLPSLVCPVIGREFRHNGIVKVAMDPRNRDSRVDLQTTLTMLWRISLPITGQTSTMTCFFYDKKLSNWPLSLVDACIAKSS